MAFANYPAFRVAVNQLIEGDDVTNSAFDTDTLDLIIGLAETRVYRELRASTMINPLSATITSNAAPLPADLLELKEAYFSGKRPLEIVPLDRLRTLEVAGYSGFGTRLCAQDGDTLRFWPAGSGTVLGSYYARPAPLASINWADATTFARHPEPFLFAALVEAMPFLGFDQRALMWNEKYKAALADANLDERRRAYGGSPLRVRAH